MRQWTLRALPGFVLFLLATGIFLRASVCISQTVVLESSTILGISSRIPVAASAEYPFPVGEKLTFDISCLLAKVGKMELTYLGTVDNEGQKVLHVKTFSEALGMKDEENVFALPDEWLPLLVRRNVIKAGLQSRIIEKYDQEAFRVVIGPEGGKPTEIIEKQAKMQNVILLYYVFRLVQLRKGQEFAINLPRKDYRVKVGAKESLSVPYGDYEVRPLTSAPEKFKVWVSLEEEPLLVKMILNGKIGTYTFLLANREVIEARTAQSAPPSTVHSVQ